jgi:hypothetical protein
LVSFYEFDAGDGIDALHSDFMSRIFVLLLRGRSSLQLRSDGGDVSTSPADAAARRIGAAE